MNCLGVEVCNKDENYRVIDCIKKSSVSFLKSYLFHLGGNERVG